LFGATKKGVKTGKRRKIRMHGKKLGKTEEKAINGWI